MRIVDQEDQETILCSVFIEGDFLHAEGSDGYSKCRPSWKLPVLSLRRCLLSSYLLSSDSCHNCVVLLKRTSK